MDTNKRVAVVVLSILMTVTISLYYVLFTNKFVGLIASFMGPLGLLILIIHWVLPIVSVLAGLGAAWNKPTSISGPLLGTVMGTATFFGGLGIMGGNLGRRV